MLLFALFLAVVPLTASERDSTKSVLLLLLGQPGLPGSQLFLSGFRSTLLSDPNLLVDVSAEFVSLSPFPTKAKRDKLVEFLNEKYGSRKFDMVITWGIDPLEFLVENKASLRPSGNTVACLLGGRDPGRPIPPDIALTSAGLDFAGTVAAIRRLQPDTRHIALVGGFAEEDRRILASARRACKEGFPDAEIIEPQGGTAKEMTSYLAHLPEHSVVIISIVTADARGQLVVGVDWLASAVRESNSPLYSVFSHIVGQGVVGGSNTDLEKVGAAVARSIKPALKDNIPVVIQPELEGIRNYSFDWRELQRWGLSEDRLPAGSEVRFRPPSFWKEYQWYIIGTLGLLVILSVSTAGLAIERKSRQRAQLELAKRLKLEAERLRFETLISNLSLPLIKASPDQLLGEIGEGLLQIVGLVGFDRASLFEVSTEVDTMTVVASVGGPDVPVFSVGEKIVLPWVTKRLRQGETVTFQSDSPNLPDDAREEWEFIRATKLSSAILVPLEESGGSLSVLSFSAFRSNVEFSPEFHTRVKIIGRIFSSVIAEKRADTQLQQALSEVTALKQKTEVENLYLREAAGALGGVGEIVGKSEGTKRVIAAIERVAPTSASVLITGETGTGKDLVASAIHRLSSRRDRPMVKLNCAALVPGLIEAELFGREKGAYTGALSRQVGRFELAHGSTIFLDEIAELGPELQVKLLRVLEEGELQRVGGTQTIKVDVRVIAATNRDLPAAVRSGKFREDLFYRLNVFPIQVPPLRERKEDIPLLAWVFAKELGDAFGKPVERFPQETMDALQKYPWPGNVRELRNVIERALIVTNSSTLRIPILPVTVSNEPRHETIKESERRIVLEALETSKWRIRGKGGAAEILGLKPSTLEYRIKVLGLKKHA